MDHEDFTEKYNCLCGRSICPRCSNCFDLCRCESVATESEKQATESRSPRAPSSDSDVFNIGYEIGLERARQDKQWGGPEHDDSHDALDWSRYIKKFLGKAENCIFGASDWNGYERNMVKVAALAVAAIQSKRRIQDER